MSLGSKYLPKQIVKSKIQMVPNITVMLSYKNKPKLSINSIKFNDDKLAWAANENSKERFKYREILWTLQCSQKYSKKIINLFKNNKNFYINKITKKFENLTGLSHKNLIFKSIHGWKYAYSLSNNNLGSFWSNKSNLGVCADWLDGPKAENAWLNSNSLFKKIKKNITKIFLIFYFLSSLIADLIFFPKKKGRIKPRMVITQMVIATFDESNLNHSPS